MPKRPARHVRAAAFPHALVTKLNPEGCPSAGSLLARVATSPLVLPALEAAVEIGSVVRVVDAAEIGGNRGIFDESDLAIAIADGLDSASAEVTLVHELRHSWQAKAGALPLLRSMDPCSRLRAVAIVEADADAYSVLVAQERRSHGDLAWWRDIESDPNLRTQTKVLQEAEPETNPAVLAARLVAAFAETATPSLCAQDEMAQWQNARRHIAEGHPAATAASGFRAQARIIAGAPILPDALERCAETVAALPLGDASPDPLLFARARHMFDAALKQHETWDGFVALSRNLPTVPARA